MAIENISRQNIHYIVAGLSYIITNIVKNTNVMFHCSTRKILSFTCLSGHTKTLNYIRQTTEQRKRVRMVSKPRGWMLFLLFSPLVAILVIGILNFNNASAQGEQDPEDLCHKKG